jgi:hypothetical protein
MTSLHMVNDLLDENDFHNVSYADRLADITWVKSPPCSLCRSRVEGMHINAF